MQEYLLSITKHLFQEITVLLFLVFLLAKTKGFKEYMLNHEASPRDKLLLSLVFGAFSILGTYTGMPVDGAIANTRAVGAVVGGLIGGPFVGAGAGLVAGIHRLFFGGTTVYASAASTIVEGFIAGLPARAQDQPAQRTVALRPIPNRRPRRPPHDASAPLPLAGTGG